MRRRQEGEGAKGRRKDKKGKEEEAPCLTAGGFLGRR